MVDWMLQNSLGLMWFTLCKKNGWTPDVEANGTLQRLEERRIEWRAKRAAGEVSLTELMLLETEEERRWAFFLLGQEIPDEAVELAPASAREWKILDPAVGSGHFLVVALGLLLALFQEEAKHRGQQDAPEWSQKGIVEHLLAHTLHGIDIDPRAVQIPAASLWLKGKALCPEIEPEQLNLVAPNLRLADLPDNDPALVSLRSDIEAETGIAGEFTSQILLSLRGADHLGSLLKIDQAVDTAIEQQERRLKALRVKAQQVQLDLSGGASPVQEEMDFSSAEARADVQELLEQFLSRHSSSNDLGLRLHGEQLAAGVRFVRLLKESSYHLVVANPPYQGTAKMSLTSYEEQHYPEGKADLYASFLLRGLELVLPGGTSAMLTMRNWLFLKQYSELRETLLDRYHLSGLLDLSSGAFDEIPPAQVVVSVAASLFLRQEQAGSRPFALRVFSEDTLTQIGETSRKRAATLAHEAKYRFKPCQLRLVPEWPLVYWWSEQDISQYLSAPSLEGIAPAEAGIITGDDTRFTRYTWEIFCENQPQAKWSYLVMGAKGLRWFEPARTSVNFCFYGLELRMFKLVSQSPRFGNKNSYYIRGVSFPMIGERFGGRLHRHGGLAGKKGSSLYPNEN